MMVFQGASRVFLYGLILILNNTVEPFYQEIVYRESGTRDKKLEGKMLTFQPLWRKIRMLENNF